MSCQRGQDDMDFTWGNDSARDFPRLWWAIGAIHTPEGGATATVVTVTNAWCSSSQLGRPP